MSTKGAMDTDIKLISIMESLGKKFNINPEILDGHELANMLTIEELALLSKEISKAIVEKTLF